MQRRDDTSYFEARAREERERAETSADAAAAIVHRKLAEAYETRLAEARAAAARASEPIRLVMR